MGKYLHRPVLETKSCAGSAPPQTAHVLRMCDRFQMLRIAAKFVAAKMVDLQAFWYRSVGQSPSYMSGQALLGFAGFTDCAKGTVTFMLPCQPRPAVGFSSPVDLFPKTFGLVSHTPYYGRI